jgi:hypothetical protein
VIVTAFIEGQIRLLAVLKNREKATVKEFFVSIPKSLRVPSSRNTLIIQDIIFLV